MKRTWTIREILREWNWLLSYVSHYKWQVMVYVVIGVVGTGLSLGTVVVSKFLIDDVVNHDSNMLPVHAVYTVALALLQFLFTALSSWITTAVGTRVSNGIREEIYSNIVSSRFEDIHYYRSGDLINRIEGDVSTVSSGVIGFIPSAITRVLQFLGSLAVVLYYDKLMALFSLMSAPFLFAISRIIMRTIRKYSSESREINGQVLSFSEESFRNIQIIKAFDLTEEYIRGFAEMLKDYRRVKMKYEKFSIFLTLILSVIGLLVSYLCYGWGIYRLWKGAITFGTMTLFLQIAGNLSSSFSSIAGLFPTAVSIATSSGRIMEVTEFEKETDVDREKALDMLKKAEKVGVGLKVENVSFIYSDGDEFVLKDATFDIKPGETVALIGTTGEGKSTFLKLMLALMKPTQGKMSLCCGDDELILSDSTRRFFSYVPQNNGVFTGTIADNLRLVKPDATDEELEEVLKVAELWEFVLSLSNGMYTEIGEMGKNISVGQAQRLTLARSLLKKAYIMLLDEATGALDSETEARVLKNIMTEHPTRICILTTHRETALQYCTKIFRMGGDGYVYREK